MKQDIKNYGKKELEEYLIRRSLPRYLADQILRWVYKKRVEDFTLMKNIAKKNRDFLADRFYFSKLKAEKRLRSRDGCEKFLFALADGHFIETVFIPEKGRGSLCLSSQVGCRFGCRFCFSGRGGFRRNLSVTEIINQYLEVSALTGRKITNVVFMGTGEPLDNFAAVVKAVRILTAPYALGLSPSRIVVSTCGLAPKIISLGKENLGVKLSVSLHAARDALRTKIMPVNKKYPLTELIEAVISYSRHSRFAVTFEYVLMRGVNSSLSHARDLAVLARRVRGKINLIVYNECIKAYNPPPPEEIKNFETELKRQRVLFTMRKSRGQDIMAACGQLRAEYNKKEEAGRGMEERRGEKEEG